MTDLFALVPLARPPISRGIARLFMKPDGTKRDFEKHFTPDAAAG